MRLSEVSVKAPVEKGWPVVSVVVAVSPPESPVSVPQAKPRTVASAPPVAVMFPFNVADVWPTEEAAEVVTVGGPTSVVNEAEIAPYEVPPELVAYALE